MSVAVQILYMVAATLFVLGVRLLGSPASARRGNRFLMAGMAIGLFTTVVAIPRFDHLVLIILIILVGTVIGTGSARRVPMTAMPQMVALFNGLGGGAAALVATGGGTVPDNLAGWLARLTMVLGSLSLGGSTVAFLKLQEWLHVPSRWFRGLRAIGVLVFILTIILEALLTIHHPTALAIVIPMFGAAASGALLTLPIGGADMPVVIALLNGLTGLSAAATGFVLLNPLLIIAGTLVGASGTILTQQMSRAMHRSVGHVLWGGLGGVSSIGAANPETPMQPITPDDAAMLLRYAQKVVIVPGFGLAVARAQMEVKQVSDLLTQFGADVLYGIHPVAGRMPGHMNVLLAEANVDYDQLWEMERINPRFRDTDVVLIIGANDVTNPAARTQVGSPLYGMPILNVDQAHNIIVIKRSAGRGFAGVDNPLYHDPKTRMLFGDAKKVLSTLARDLEETV